MNNASPFDMSKINIIFKKRGNWMQSPTNDATFLYMDCDTYEDQKKSYSYRSDVTNAIKINPNKNLNKCNLYNIFKRYDPILVEKFMMKQYDINLSNFKFIDKNIFKKPHILKPVHSWAGVGIVIFSDYNDYYQYLNNYSSKKIKLKGKKSNPQWVLAEYIENPLLFENRKFHLRIPFLYYDNRGYIANQYQIVTAGSEYIKSDLQNKNAHDTHWTGSLMDYFFPDNFKNKISDTTIYLIQNRIDELFYHVTKIMINNCFGYDCYEGTKHCFTVYGADVMITEDYEVKLLEINSRPGFVYNNNYMEGMINDLALIILDKLYPPENKIFDKKIFFKDITLITNVAKHELLDGEYYNKYTKYKKKYMALKSLYNSNHI